MDDHCLSASLTADIIKEKFPGRVVLTTAEVAIVMKNRHTRDIERRICDRLKAGTLIPGLKKQGGRWEVPVDALVRAIDGMVVNDVPSLPLVEKMGTASRRRRPIGPRLLDAWG